MSKIYLDMFLASADFAVAAYFFDRGREEKGVYSAFLRLTAGAGVTIGLLNLTAAVMNIIAIAGGF